MTRYLIHYSTTRWPRSCFRSLDLIRTQTAIAFTRPEIRAFQLKCREMGWQLLWVEVDASDPIS